MSSGAGEDSVTAAGSETSSPPTKKARLEDASSTTLPAPASSAPVDYSNLVLPAPIASGTLDLSHLVSRTPARSARPRSSDFFDDDPSDFYDTPPGGRTPAPARAPTTKIDDDYESDYDMYISESESKPAGSKSAESKPVGPLPGVGLPGIPGIRGLGPIQQSNPRGVSSVVASKGNGPNGKGASEEIAKGDKMSYHDAHDDVLNNENSTTYEESNLSFIPGLSSSMSIKDSIPGLSGWMGANEGTLPGLGGTRDSSGRTLPGLGGLTGTSEGTLPGVGNTMSSNRGFLPGLGRPMGANDSVLPSVEAEWEVDSNPEASTTTVSSGSDADNDGDDYPLLDPEEQARILMQVERDSEDEGEGGLPVNAAKRVKTKNEITEQPMEKPQVAVTSEMKILELGRISSIVGSLVVIQAKISGEFRVLEAGSVLCLADRTVIGTVSETLGRVERPSYIVRFKTLEEIAGLHLTVTTPIFYVESHSTYILTQALKKAKGSDASNFYDEEVGDDEVEFSDDEAEAAHKRRAKEQRQARRRGGGGGGGGGGRAGPPLTRPSASVHVPLPLPGLSYDEPSVPAEADDDDDGAPYKRLARPSNYQALVGGSGSFEEIPSRDHYARGFRRGHPHDGGRGRGFRGRGGRRGFGHGRPGRPDHRRNPRDGGRRTYGSGPSHRSFSPPATSMTRSSPPAPLPPQHPQATSSSYPAISPYDPPMPSASTAASSFLASVFAPMSAPPTTPNLGPYQQPYTSLPASTPQQLLTPQQHAALLQQFYAAQPAPVQPPVPTPPQYPTTPRHWFPSSAPGPPPFQYSLPGAVPPSSAPARGGVHAGGPLPAGAFVNPAFFRNAQSTPMRSQHTPAATQSVFSSGTPSAFSPSIEPTMSSETAFRLAQEKIDLLKQLTPGGSGPA